MAIDEFVRSGAAAFCRAGSGRGSRGSYFGPVRIATRSYGETISAADWYIPAGGEAGYIVPDPTDPTISYGGEYDGIMIRHDKKNEQYQLIS